MKGVWEKESGVVDEDMLIQNNKMFKGYDVD